MRASRPGPSRAGVMSFTMFVLGLFVGVAGLAVLLVPRLRAAVEAARAARHESVITALIGAALGLPLGIFLALLVTQALSKYDSAISIPLPELAGFTVVAVLFKKK